MEHFGIGELLILVPVVILDHFQKLALLLEVLQDVVEALVLLQQRRLVALDHLMDAGCLIIINIRLREIKLSIPPQILLSVVVHLELLVPCSVIIREGELGQEVLLRQLQTIVLQRLVVVVFFLEHVARRHRYG